MQDKISKSLDTIIKAGLSSDRCLGSILSSVFFDNMAVFVDDQYNTYLLTSDVAGIKKGKEMVLVDLLATLADFEKRFNILVAKSERLCFPILFFANSNGCTVSQLDGHYEIGNQQQLIVDDEKAKIVENQKTILDGYRLPQALSDRVVYYLTSVIYSTEELKEYVKRGYQTEEIRQTKRANTISIASVCIAILVAISAPFLTIWWGNTHGKSTVTESQYKALINTIQDSKVAPKDTVYVKEAEPIKVLIQNKDKGEKEAKK